MSKALPLSLPLLVDHYTPRGGPIAYMKTEMGSTKVSLSSGVPGDELLVELGKKRRGKCQGWVKDVLTPSPLRVPARCQHAPSCGGCAWQEVDYGAQLALKQKTLDSLFENVITPQTTVHPIIPCSDPWEYRNKMEFSFSQDARGNAYMGLMLRSGRGRVFNLLECHLTSLWFATAVNATRSWWEESGLQAYHPYRDTGALRTLTLREGHHTGHKMAILTVSGRPEFAITRKQMMTWAECLQQKLDDQNVSLFVRVHQAIKGQPTSFYELHLGGPECLLEELHVQTLQGLSSYTLQISPGSFFQPNTRQAEILYARALEIVNPSPSDHVLDLYCGTGTIGMVFARRVQRVTSIELNPYAILDAQANCTRNGISNIRLLKGDANEKLTEVLQEGAVFDVIIVDPPRSGLGPKAVQTVLRTQAKSILYVACNPTTQAEDVKVFLENGYNVMTLQPVDQFPHTPHLENIVFLKKS